MTSPDAVELLAFVAGRVQGVGFRFWTAKVATQLGLVGSAVNLDDGRVRVVAQGPRAVCEHLLVALRGTGTPGEVKSVVERWGEPASALAGFVTG
jgi:acylphosphatase